MEKNVTKRKNKIITGVLAFSAILGVIIVVGLYTYLSPKKTTIYAFKDNYKAGTEITEDMLTPIECDAKIVVGGSSKDTGTYFVTGKNIDDILKSGDSLRLDVSRNTPLVESLLSINGGSSIEMAMDPTKVAVSVPVTEITGVTKELQSGSRVNIYVTGDKGTDCHFQNMKVLRTECDSNDELCSATIEVDNNQAQRLIDDINKYSIHLGLVDAAKYKQ